MLSGNNNRNLSAQQISGQYIFFFQRWKELLDNRTLDMYQYDILNSYTACVELSDVIEKTMSGLLVSRQNLDESKAEALEIVKADKILEKHNYALRNILLRILGSKVEGKTRGDIQDEKNGIQYISLNRLKYQLQTPGRQLEKHYLLYILAELKESIESEALSEIEENMKALISQCIAKGWSAKGLFLLVDCFCGGADDETKWNYFKDRLTMNVNDSFEIYYSIKIETRAGLSPDNVRDAIRTLGLQVKIGHEIIDDRAERQDLYSKLDAEKTYIITTVSAPDSYAGALSAINMLYSKLSIATFYNTISPWVANMPYIVVYNVATQASVPLRLTDIFKTYDYIDSRNGVFEDTNHIFSDSGKASITAKLGAAFAYTNLSRASLFQETKYISLWIALESVMRTGQYTDIISHIKLVLPETLCIRYVYRIIRNFSEDCIRCGFKTCTALDVDMQSQDKKSLVRRLISIFRNEEEYPVLLTCCSQNDLLEYRCQEIHGLLTDVEAIKKKLDHYAQKVRWHIQRLYRIRNEITHSAFKEDKSLVIYIEHLYTYLAQLMSEVVYYVEHKEVYSVEEAYAIIVETYKTYRALLDEGTLPIEEIVPEGIIEII